MAKKQGSKKNIAGTVRELVESTVTGLGYVLWDVEYKKEGSDYNLILTLDSVDGSDITIDDCVKVNDAVNPILDEADPIDDSYYLEVSSAGLERELSKDEHFEKYLGSEVEVKLFAPHEIFKKQFTATLLENTPDALVFSNGDERVAIEKDKIATVKTVVDFEKIMREKQNEEI